MKSRKTLLTFVLTVLFYCSLLRLPQVFSFTSSRIQIILPRRSYATSDRTASLLVLYGSKQKGAKKKSNAKEQNISMILSKRTKMPLRQTAGWFISKEPRVMVSNRYLQVILLPSFTSLALFRADDRQRRDRLLQSGAVVRTLCSRQTAGDTSGGIGSLTVGSAGSELRP